MPTPNPSLPAPAPPQGDSTNAQPPGRGGIEPRGRLFTSSAPTDQARAEQLAPQFGPFLLMIVLVGASIAAVTVVWPSSGNGFTPRVATVDGLAGLVVGAFLVDRLLTFLPPTVSRYRDGLQLSRWMSFPGIRMITGKQPATDRTDRTPEEREAAIAVLRIGWGAVLGAAFVGITGLRAVQALVGDAGNVSVEVDRAIAVLALAGGTVGLTSLSSALSAKSLTDTELKSQPKKARETADGKKTAPPTAALAYLVGLAILCASFGAAWFKASGDTAGVDLLGVDQAADATTALVIRFGLLLLAAGIVQQAVALIDRAFTSAGKPVAEEARGPLLGGVAVGLGVAAAAAMDIYLLHNLGFFGVSGSTTLDAGLAASTDLERVFDLFITGVVIAAGTKPLSDVATRMRKAKANGQQAESTSPAAAEARVHGAPN